MVSTNQHPSAQSPAPQKPEKPFIPTRYLFQGTFVIKGKYNSWGTLVEVHQGFSKCRVNDPGGGRHDNELRCELLLDSAAAFQHCSIFSGNNLNELKDKSQRGNQIHRTCPIIRRATVDQSAPGKMFKMIQPFERRPVKLQAGHFLYLMNGNKKVTWWSVNRQGV